MAHQLCRYGSARRCVYGIEETQCKFRVMTFLIGRMRELLHVQVRENPQ